MAVAPVFYSLSPYGTGDIKTGSPTLTISSGVATLTVAQSGNIGVGCDIDFDDPAVNVYIAPNRLGFDSGGTTELKTGDKIEGNSSGATGIIRAIEITSGSWAGGDAAGYLYFSTTSGTWQNNEQINRTKPSTSANIATADGTLQGNLGNGNTQFVVKDPDGADASDVGSAETVNSIHHEYASLSAFEAGFTDANHINDSDLTNAAVIAHACCYYDHDDQTTDTTAVTINWGGTTDADNYLQIYTPIGNAEAINNQRHDGKKNTNRYLIEVTDNNIIYNQEDYTRSVGLQIQLTSTTSTIRRATWLYNTTGCYVKKGLYIGVGAGRKFGIQCEETNTNITNYIHDNIVYDMDSGGSYIDAGIANSASGAANTTNLYAYNNTVHNCRYGFYFAGSGTKNSYLKNNIANDCLTDDYSSAGDSTSTHNIGNKNTTDLAFGATHSTGTATTDSENHLVDTGATFQTDGVQVNSVVKNTTDTTYGYVTAVNSETDLTLDSDVFPDGDEGYEVYTNMYGAVTFEDEGNDDFHLGSADTVAKDKGTDLSTDANLPIWDDIDSDERSGTWDVGADEYIAATTTTTTTSTTTTTTTTTITTTTSTTTTSTSTSTTSTTGTTTTSTTVTTTLAPTGMRRVIRLTSGINTSISLTSEIQTSMTLTSDVDLENRS